MNNAESKLEQQGYGQIFGGDYAGCWHKGGVYYRFDGKTLIPVNRTAEPQRVGADGGEPPAPPPAEPINPDLGGDTGGEKAKTEEEIVKELLENSTDDEIFLFANNLHEKLVEAGKPGIKDDILAPDADDKDRTSGKLNAELIAKHVAG